MITRLRHLIRSPGGERQAVVELDRWQLTGLLMLMLVLTAGAFFIGLTIGGRNTRAVSEPEPTLARALPKTNTTQERHIALAEVWPPTIAIDRDLARPITAPLPSDPTERARALAHQQLQDARSAGLRNDVVAPAPVGAQPLVVANPDPAQGATGYTLQVSIFETQSAAQAIASELAGAGHAVRIRVVRAADGRDMYRVEVGEFSTADAATAFQRRFERDSGYSAVLVPF